MSQAPAEVTARVARLFIYPVKSCAGVEVSEALLTETGFDLDRAWMAVDAEGDFVSQRQLPRMSLIHPQVKHSEVVLRAPGMLALHLRIDTVEEPATVRVWDDVVPAFDMGDLAAQWFSDFLGQKLRLVRFDPEHRRLSNMKWTQGVEAPNQFGDGFPLLVASEASLQELNRRLEAKGHAPVGIERFRPNIVLSGIEAHDEDRLGDIRIAASGGDVVLRPVKPCGRCPIPDIDPGTAQSSPEVGDTLRDYRRNEILGGAISFAMNAIAIEGIDRVVKTGQPVTSSWRFD
ncbi:MOSC domain-containing protein [Caenimonas aquaedulcis]|uniref:MOSC N-terminal beta barrel domain-containing protein n=1 Tax=Caenimonas aquaedulcis TaxID=2793270 RepID=A0A931H6C7_9BURK|nr:MOSC N-terminal beta barrel domain-containing protein [Caenimonas aquaedulcis]MBG9389474.1 MOSC N-terminal beta barrel domain-containing protein [Caenimonas aquaedulcis]